MTRRPPEPSVRPSVRGVGPQVARRDVLTATAVLLAWSAGVLLASTWDYWIPTSIEAHLGVGSGLVAPLALRRIAPAAGFWVTVVGYPVGYATLVHGDGLHADIHALPLLVVAFIAAYAGLAPLLVGPVSAVALVAMQQGPLELARLAPLDLAPEPAYAHRPYFDLSRAVLLVLLVVSATALGSAFARLSTTSRSLSESNAQLRALQEERARVAVREEQTRIARELHDVVAHHIMAIIIRAQAAQMVADSEPTARGDALTWIIPTGREALTAMRSAVRALRPRDDPSSAPLAPGAELRELPETIERIRGAGLSIDAHLPSPLPLCPPQVGMAIVRVAQEALTNVLAHSAATSAAVRLTTDGPTWVLVVRDPGPADSGRHGTSGGHGIGNMRERAAACSGTLTSGPAADGGWIVRMELPRRAGPDGATPVHHREMT